MRGGARVKDPAKLKNRKKKQLVLDQDLFDAITDLKADEYNQSLRLGIMAFQNNIPSNPEDAKERLLKKQSDWLMINTRLPVEQIVEFTEHFKQ